MCGSAALARLDVIGPQCEEPRTGVRRLRESAGPETGGSQRSRHHGRPRGEPRGTLERPDVMLAFGLLALVEGAECLGRQAAVGHLGDRLGPAACAHPPGAALVAVHQVPRGQPGACLGGVAGVLAVAKGLLERPLRRAILALGPPQVGERPPQPPAAGTGAHGALERLARLARARVAQEPRKMQPGVLVSGVEPGGAPKRGHRVGGSASHLERAGKLEACLGGFGLEGHGGFERAERRRHVVHSLGAAQAAELELGAEQLRVERRGLAVVREPLARLGGHVADEEMKEAALWALAQLPLILAADDGSCGPAAEADVEQVGIDEVGVGLEQLAHGLHGSGRPPAAGQPLGAVQRAPSATGRQRRCLRGCRDYEQHQAEMRGKLPPLQDYRLSRASGDQGTGV